jgi:hypothetical protein
MADRSLNPRGENWHRLSERIPVSVWQKRPCDNCGPSPGEPGASGSWPTAPPPREPFSERPSRCSLIAMPPQKALEHEPVALVHHRCPGPGPVARREVRDAGRSQIGRRDQLGGRHTRIVPPSSRSAANGAWPARRNGSRCSSRQIPGRSRLPSGEGVACACRARTAELPCITDSP